MRCFLYLDFPLAEGLRISFALRETVVANLRL